MPDPKPPPKTHDLSPEWIDSVRRDVLDTFAWHPEAQLEVPLPVGGEGNLRITPELSDWLKNPPSLEDDDQRTVSMTVPIVAGEDVLGTATFRPVLTSDQWGLSLTIEW